MFGVEKFSHLKTVLATLLCLCGLPESASANGCGDIYASDAEKAAFIRTEQVLGGWVTANQVDLSEFEVLAIGQRARTPLRQLTTEIWELSAKSGLTVDAIFNDFFSLPGVTLNPAEVFEAYVRKTLAQKLASDALIKFVKG